MENSLFVICVLIAASFVCIDVFLKFVLNRTQKGVRSFVF